MLPRFFASTAAIIALATSMALFPLDTPGSKAQSARSGSGAQTTTIGEMVPTQGWFWDLFGGSRNEPPRSEPRREPQEGQGDEFPRRRQGASGVYRTVCVRLCDGFHWPISHSTTRERFARDADRCEQACPGRSRLFVHRSSDDKPAAMKDLDGQPYAKLENAFRHQREYVSDCTCRGNPWDEEARARHRAYAEAVHADKGKAVAKAEKPRGEPRQASRRERDGGRSQRWARSGWGDRTGNDD